MTKQASAAGDSAYAVNTELYELVSKFALLYYVKKQFRR